MMQRNIIITGASDGIGAAAARELRAKGENVILVGRSIEKTEAIAKELRCTFYTVDFADLEDVRRLASDLNKDLDRIDVLVNNAGAVMSKRELTKDGNEKTLQVNHLASFLLTSLLINRLIRSKATVINTSSIANSLLSDFDIDNLNLEHGYTPTKAYGNSKLANILFTKELDRRYRAKGISAVAFHPGNIATNFSKDSSSLFMKLVYRSPLRHLLASPAKGARTLVWLAESKPGISWEPGEYYVGEKKSKPDRKAEDMQLAKDLWLKSEELTMNNYEKSKKRKQ